MKKCTKCLIDKDYTDFYHDPRNGNLRAKCKQCMKSHHASYLASNGKEVRKAFDAQYYKTDELYQKRKEFRELPENKIKNAKYQTQYHLNFPEKGRYHTAKRRAIKLKATPKWLTEDHFKQIERYYQTAKWLESILEEQIDVDHIIPLQGKNVCGLHAPWNMQLLKHTDNLKKSNK
jgi:hypothetical protein